MDEKEAKINSLERQRSRWERRLKELRAIGVSALCPEYVNKHIIKCKEEIRKIDEALRL